MLLKEVTINAKTPLIERKADRLIYNVGSSISAQGSNALEILSKIPGVSVRSDKISLIAKSGVSIMINDKLVHLSGSDLQNYLQTIPSEQLYKIEVITNPPAKYEAEGNSGIINIVFKKDRNEGYHGMINATYEQATYPNAFYGALINFNKNKWSVSAQINPGLDSYKYVENYKIYYPTVTWGQIAPKRYNYMFLNGNLSLQYRISKKNIITLSSAGHVFKSDLTLNAESTITNPTTLAVDSTIYTNSDEDGNKSNNSFGLEYKYLFDTSGRTMIINLDKFSYKNIIHSPISNNIYNSQNILIPGSANAYISDGMQGDDFYTANVDFELPVKKITFSFGGKLSFIENHNQISKYNKVNSDYILDSTNTNQFQYNENMQALYCSVNMNIKKFKIKAGIRGENTQTKGLSVTTHTDIANHYFRLFSTFYITYLLNDHNAFSFNYGARIHRPNYFYLNPFRSYYSAYAYSEGNPFLQPSYKSNMEVSYNYKDFLPTSLSFNYSTNGYEQLTFTNKKSYIQVTHPVNFLTGYSYAYNFFYILKKFDWMESTNQITLGYNIMKSSIPETQSNLTGTLYYFSSNNQFFLNQKHSSICFFNFWYQPPYIDQIDQIDHMKESGKVDIGFRQMVFDKKLTFNFLCSGILNTSGYRMTTYINTMEQYYSNYYDTRRVAISISYSFGNSNIKKIQKQNSDEEEKSRVH